jgi:adenosylcobinamide-GDP ribazoletransferase
MPNNTDIAPSGFLNYHTMKKQLHIFLNALMFYSRIPVPSWMHHNEEMLNRATVYFPVIGWIVAGISGLVYWLCTWIFPPSVAVLLSMGAGILTTGAFHEDGLADVCDGFGGGWTKIKILDIMKDSRVGTYGVVGLLLALLLKYATLTTLDIRHTLLALIIAHPLSRLTALSMIYTHEYVREDALSKVKPIGKKISLSELLLAGFWAFLPFVFIQLYWPNWAILGVVLPLCITKWYLARYFTKWIGGYTGDCLGSIQQISEIVIYLYLIAIWKFI